MTKDEVAKEKAVKGEMAKDKEATGTLSKMYSPKIFYILIAAIAGAGLALLGTFINDWRIDNQTREDVQKMICYDVQNTTSTLDEFLKVTSRENMIKQSKDPNWTPYFSDYDTSVYDAYLNKFSLLPENSVRIILLFYRNLRTINGDKYTFQNMGSNMSSKEREACANIIYESIYRTAKVGKEMITDDKKLNTTERNESYYGIMDAASSTIHIAE